jgi:GTP cyclohydrolase II
VITEFTSHEISVEGKPVPVRMISSFGVEPEHDSNAAAVYGEPRNGSLVRIHSRCIYSEVFASRECDCGWQLRKARERLTVEGGVLIYLDQEGRGAGLKVKAEAYKMTHEDGLDTYEAFEKLGVPLDLRDYTDAAKILMDLGLTEIRLMTNNPTKIAALESKGVKVTRVPLKSVPTPATIAYLEAKKRHGHLL